MILDRSGCRAQAGPSRLFCQPGRARDLRVAGEPALGEHHLFGRAPSAGLVPARARRAGRGRLLPGRAGGSGVRASRPDRRRHRGGRHPARRRRPDPPHAGGADRGGRLRRSGRRGAAGWRSRSAADRPGPRAPRGKPGARATGTAGAGAIIWRFARPCSSRAIRSAMLVGSSALGAGSGSGSRFGFRRRFGDGLGLRPGSGSTTIRVPAEVRRPAPARPEARAR